MWKATNKLSLAACIASAGALTMTGYSATVTWDAGGSDGIWQTAGNWDSDTVPATNDDVIINNGDTVTYSPGDDLKVEGGGSVTVSGGSTLTQSTSHWAQVNGGQFTLNNSALNFTHANNKLVLGLTTSSSATFVATNSTVSLAGELWLGHNNNTGNQVISMDLTNSSIDANGAVGIWFWDTDASGNDFTLNINGGGTTIEGRVGRRNSVSGQENDVSWEALWNEGILTYNGSNDGEFADYFITSGTPGTTGYVLTSVPEPSSTALIGLAGVGFILRRRR